MLVETKRGEWRRREVSGDEERLVETLRREERDTEKWRVERL
jgi:hypothetical protein